MHKWILAAAFVPALSLATPITFTTSTGKNVTVKVKNTSTKPSAGASTGGGSIGTAAASDVTLGGISANQLIYSPGINPQAGANGDSSGFAAAYANSGSGDWSSVAKFAGSSTSTSASLSGLVLTMGFSLSDTRHGTWSLTNNDSNNNLSLDLVFAMHTGGGSGSWLFDNFLLSAGSTANGSWALNLLNNGNSYADYSNLTLFARNAAASPVVVTPTAAAPVPVVTPAVPAPTPVVNPTVIETPAPAPTVVLLDDPAPTTPAPQSTGNSGSGGGLSFDIPLSELLSVLIEHDLASPGIEVEFVGLFDNEQQTQVPEPGSAALVLSALALLGLAMRRGRRA